MIRLFLFPATAAFVSGAAFYVLSGDGGFEWLDATIMSLIVFAVLLTVSNHIRLTYSTWRLEKKMGAAADYEAGLLRRMAELERDLRSIQANSAAKEELEDLHREVADMLAKEIRGGSSSENFDTLSAGLSATDKQNVIPIGRKPENGQAGKQTRKENSRPNDHALRSVPDLAGVLEHGTFTMKLEPVVNLMERKPVAVEALPRFLMEGGAIRIEEIAEKANVEGLLALDLLILEHLQRVYRTMLRKNQVLPIHVSLYSLPVINREKRERLASLLEGDPGFAANLVVMLTYENYRKCSAHSLGTILSMRQYGTEIAVSNCHTPAAVKNVLTTGQIAIVKMDVKDMLRYAPNSNVRLVQELVSSFEDTGSTLIATGVGEPHEASALIDADVLLAQGAFVAPAREVKLQFTGQTQPSGAGL